MLRRIRDRPVDETEGRQVRRPVIRKLAFATVVVMILLGALSSGAQLPIIWSEDFSGGSIPLGWSSEDTSGNDRQWSWCGDPTNGVGAAPGSFVGCHRVWDDALNQQVPFASSTAANGFLTVDSDAAGNVTHVSELTFGPFFISEPQPDVFVEFETQIGVFTLDADDNALLRVSTDGVNWTPFTIFPGLTTGAPNPPTERWSNNPERKIVNVSPVGGSQSVLFLQWQWTANYEFHWNIDDFVLKAGVAQIFADGFESGDTSAWLP